MATQTSTRAAITELFTSLADPETQKQFFARVADSVDWWIVGSTPMSGTYDSKAAFQDATLKVLNNRILGGPLGFRLVNLLVDSERRMATAEMQAINARCRNGMEYDMRYCWVVRFGEDDVDGQGPQIVQVRAYIDTALLDKAMEQNP